jgi:hypothetical protein
MGFRAQLRHFWWWRLCCMTAGPVHAKSSSARDV